MLAGPEAVLAQQKIINGVTVVSTILNGNINALTVAWVSRVSYNPPRLMVSIGKTRHSHNMIKESGVFAVNVLGPEGIETARHFGLTSGRNTDKFEGIEYDTKVTGSPILADSIAWMDCRVVSQHDAGSHTVFIGEILDAAARRDEAPLIYDKKNFFNKKRMQDREMKGG